MRYSSEAWIIGSSIIHWAHRAAISPPQGQNLGLNEIGINLRWLGVRGMRWSQLLPKVSTLLAQHPPPDILIIHVGANDILSIPSKTLAANIQTDLATIRQRLELTMLVWSDLLPRLIWSHSENTKAMEKTRKRINRIGGSTCIRLGGRRILHPAVTHLEPKLYRSDGVHLSDIGNQTFLRKIKLALCTFVSTEDALI